jgi:hypothetical protein
MAKRHHSSTHHPFMHKPGHHEAGSGYEEEKHREYEDGGMISSDHSKIANMPQEVIMKPWPDGDGYLPEGLDDTIKGVDHQEAGDHSQMKKTFNPRKY